MRSELRFPDEIQRLRAREAAAGARDRESRLNQHRAIRAAIDREIEDVLAAAAAKRRAYQDDWLEQHRIREQAHREEKRIRAEELFTPR